ncbi:hypothetical protein [Streptomyces europaeiscabiei]|uniref:hypothetical protein n=1 Tax=Streptomyces europaeiscabiei TaxID=146819 RepID=UPI002E172C32
MSRVRTLDDLSVPLRALRLLAVDFGHLPAPEVRVSTIYPNRLELTFYDDLTGFEAWRETLRVAPDTVTYREQSDGRTRVLKASADYGGAVLELVGYGDVQALVPVGASV